VCLGFLLHGNAVLAFDSIEKNRFLLLLRVFKPECEGLWFEASGLASCHGAAGAAFRGFGH